MGWSYDVYAIQGVMIARQFKEVIYFSCQCPARFKSEAFCAKCGRAVKSGKEKKEIRKDSFEWSDMTGTYEYKDYMVLDSEFQDCIFIGKNLGKIDGRGSSEYERIDPTESFEENLRSELEAEGFEVIDWGIFLVNVCM